jgi:repressor LexA
MVGAILKSLTSERSFTILHITVEPLTKRQEKVLSTVLALTRRHGLPPTYRELGRALGIASTHGVRRHLEALQRKGYLRIRATARGLALADEARGIPVLGRIAAGRPIEALENYEGTVDFGAYPDTFAVRIVGDSMIDAGINDGDLALVRAGARVENGQIAAVAVEGEATVKRVYAEPHGLRLVPENPKHQETVVTGEDVRILGRVVGIVRRF